MSKIFVEKTGLSLKGGSYLVAGKNETPVSNKEFVAAQVRAEYIVTFADACKGKDFKGKAADSLTDVMNSVNVKLADKNKKYVDAGAKPTGTMQSKLAKEALDFINFDKKSSNADKINNFLQEFNIIDKFEKIGLYFDEEVVELNKIYTMAEVIKAVEATIDLV